MSKRIAPAGLRGEPTEYTEYLAGAHWKNTRRSALLLARYRCRECGAGEGLEVHHLHYRTLYAENVLTDLEVLCAACHQKKHRRKGQGGWKRSPSGNWVRFLRGGDCVTVFEREPRYWESPDAPEWCFVCDGEYSGSYGSPSAAMAGADRLVESPIEKPTDRLAG